MLNPVKYLYFHARMKPDAFAIQSFNLNLTYGQLLIIIQKFAATFRRSGVKPGQIVALMIADPSWHWILTLALFHEAAVPCSSSKYTLTNENLGIDWVLSDRAEFDGGPAGRHLFIDSAWVQKALSGEPLTDPLDYPDEDSVCRLILTSGTTGASKAVALTVRTLEIRLSLSWFYWATPGREMNMMPIGTTGGFATALNILAAGNVFFAVPRNRSVLDAVNFFKINSLIGSPMQIRSMVQDIQNGKPYEGSVRILRSAGGAIAPLLLKNIKENLCEKVMNVYGSTEAGPIGAISESNDHAAASIAGFPLPNVRIQIVNQSHEILPQGQEGTIRVRTPGMVHEYYKDPVATSSFFRDGWFYPGDTGRLTKNGFLALSGRGDELINRGGIKINLDSLDLFLNDYHGVQDAATFSFENSDGVQDIAAAIVVAKDFEIKALQGEMLKKHGKARTPDFFVKVDQIPRNPMGKVLRAKLSEDFSATLYARGSQVSWLN
ncbi:MAG: class I adenylate-forming enzyme family protein [Thermodesulfobacteriota bacterium]